MIKHYQTILIFLLVAFCSSSLVAYPVEHSYCIFYFDDSFNNTHDSLNTTNSY